MKAIRLEANHSLKFWGSCQISSDSGLLLVNGVEQQCSAQPVRIVGLPWEPPVEVSTATTTQLHVLADRSRFFPVADYAIGLRKVVLRGRSYVAAHDFVRQRRKGANRTTGCNGAHDSSYMKVVEEIVQVGTAEGACRVGVVGPKVRACVRGFSPTPCTRQGAGKSTIARAMYATLETKSRTETPGVLFYDMDPGQPECSVPGTLSVLDRLPGVGVQCPGKRQAKTAT